jgi:hypothetical protein
MANEVSDRPHVIFEFLAEGKDSTYEARDPLPQGIVQMLDMNRFPCSLGNRFVLSLWNDTCVGFVLIRVKGSPLTIRRRDVGPPGASRFGYKPNTPDL